MTPPMRPQAALARRVADNVDLLARRMTDAFVAEIPVYAHLPREQLDGEILQICCYNLRVFLRFLAEGDAPGDRELAPIKTSAARRAEERVPLETVLIAYHIGSRIGWEALCDVALPSEHADLLAAARIVIAYTQIVTSEVSAAYLEERQAIYGEEREAHRSLAKALLAGAPAAVLAERFGYRLADRYRVVALAIDASPDERTAGVEPSVAGRRKLRRIEQCLGDHLLGLLEPYGGTVLVPAPAPVPTAGEDPSGVDPIRELVAGIAAAAGAPVRAAVTVQATDEGLPAAAAQAHEVLRLLVRLRVPPGAYTLDDVLLEYVLSMAGPAGHRLADALAPVENGPQLIETLGAWFAADFNRRRTAAALHIHPNTLDYRLARIGELTGFSPATARGVQLLGAALTLRKLGTTHNADPAHLGRGAWTLGATSD
jgi:hypothetical protein